MNSKKEISVIIPAYNSAGTISDCLKTVFNQTFKDFEVIVVNDGSQDDLAGALEPWRSRLKLINSPKNQGAAAARNLGFRASQGKYLFFADADLLLKPKLFEKMRRVLENYSEPGYVYSSFKFGWKRFCPGSFSAAKLKAGPFIHTSSLIRRECFPGFDPKLKKFQDWDLWLTILEAGWPGIWIAESLFTVRAGGTISCWLPKFAYQLFPWLTAVKKYRRAEKIIKEKHGL